MGEFFVVSYMLFSCDLDWLSFEIEKCLLPTPPFFRGENVRFRVHLCILCVSSSVGPDSIGVTHRGEYFIFNGSPEEDQSCGNST